MKNRKNIRKALYLSAIWLILFGLLQVLFRYNFYTIEGVNLFLFNASHISCQIVQPGGLAFWLSKLLIQLYAYPLFGAAITATVLALVCGQLYQILGRIKPSPYILLPLIPGLLLLFAQFDLNFYLQGILAVSIMLGFFQEYIVLKRLPVRLGYAIITIPLLFFLAGSVSMLYAFTILLWEFLKRRKWSFWFLIPLLEAVIISAGSVFYTLVGDFRFAFLPDMYYQPLITTIPYVIYSTWLSIPLVIVLAWLARNRREPERRQIIVENSVQFILLIGFLWVGISQFGDLRSRKFREIDYYAQTENWDKVIDLCHGSLNNYLYTMNLNIALANKGILADRLFFFDQKGPQGLYPQWSKQYPILVLLSDFHFTTGNIAGALHTAFEANIASGNSSPRMMKRLIQSYLILGNYAIAERYLNILSETLHYSAWAKAHRRFLYNDEAINNDPVLGLKRRTKVDKNFLYTVEGTDYTLAETARHNPIHKAAIEYLGSTHLLTKDLNAFEAFLEEFYGTDILPVLPVSFQEAAVILYEPQPEKWTHYKINNDIIARFGQFKQDYIMARNNPAYMAVVEQKYVNTYWYYLMIK